MANAPETNILVLAEEAHRIAANNGFWETERNKAEMIALEHSELSERLEAIRKPGMSEKIPNFTEEEEEWADLFIRMMDYAVGHELEFARAIQAKMEYNRTRPYKHGKNF